VLQVPISEQLNCTFDVVIKKKWGAESDTESVNTDPLALPEASIGKKPEK
jgi:hypothetical protein